MSNKADTKKHITFELHGTGASKASEKGQR